MRSAISAIAVVLLLAGSASAQGTKSVPAQKKALLAFAKAANSQLWNIPSATSWTDLTDPCLPPGWLGVTCDASGNIEKIELATPVLPNPINLQGNIPAALSALTKLTVLDLEINTGLKDITAIAKIASLKQLVLIGNGGKVVPGFASKLTNLEKLIVNLNVKGAIPADYSKLTKLTLLDLSSNVLSGKLPVGYSKLTKLSELTVKSNLLTGNIPKEYSTLINLSKITVAQNKLTGPVPSTLTNLNVAGPAFPAANGKLTALDACGNDASFIVSPDFFTAGVIIPC